ncbi:MAG: FKBP-type peptidyl-prolyl cis-trans isomerase [Bacteroidota bacterium]|jgi:FKBP-type peptidyl-prolyl cis-trans isomerase
MKLIFAFFISLFLLIILNSGFITSEQNEHNDLPKFLSGYTQVGDATWFKLLHAGTGTDTAGAGGLIFARVALVNEHDSILSYYNPVNTAASFPLKLSAPKFKGDQFYLFARLHRGDSAKWFINYDTLKKYYPATAINSAYFEKLNSTQYVGFVVKVDSIFSKERLAQPRKQPETVAELRAKSKQAIATYLADNNLNHLQPDKNGIYYKELIPGKGLRVMPGMKVSVLYKGTFTDGRVFETNMGDSKRKPLIFIAGQRMIPGFTDCILRMKDGGKSFFILPPEQAYGEKGEGVIPPWTPLVYEAEVKIIDANTRN